MQGVPEKYTTLMKVPVIVLLFDIEYLLKGKYWISNNKLLISKRVEKYLSGYPNKNPTQCFLFSKACTYMYK